MGGGEGTVSATRWLHPPDVDPDAPTRLFLFHYSGGGVSMYGDWPALIPSDVACQRVQLPGRQDRHREPPFTELAPLVDALTEVLADELDGRPYGLFGHSMGALLAYRLGVAMPRAGHPGPALVGVSGWTPVGFSMPPRAAIVDGSDDAILAGLRAMNSPPIRMLTATELRTLVVPLMRADLSVVAGYRDDGALLDCPVVAYGGRDDRLVTPLAMRAWTTRTPVFLGVREFPGDHFFIHEHGPAVAADLVQLLRRYAAP